ncbi:flavin reductase domain-containing protein [Caballeronia catudaia]|uniref:Flavin reductase domain-containing protein n=1 Tax=Caballeronia catudaia TaxID=1777136 RepID=A0A158B1H8_9BURK|nr:flavin reductase family protein [Caballeronia catudaia]SAK63853.1 flavin reductase domain-containing protein [Caballeronia catudaia]
MTDNMADLFRRLTAGVYVIGVADGDRRNAFTASSIMQVSFRPLLVALSINPTHASYPILNGGRVFTINVLRADQQALAEHFGTQSGRAVDKLSSMQWRAGRTRAPLLIDALACFECQIVLDVEAGDHRLIVGRVVDGAVLAPDAQPLLYAATGNLDQSAELYSKEFCELT